MASSSSSSSSLKKVATRVMGTRSLADAITTFFNVSSRVVDQVLDARERVCELVEEAPSHDFWHEKGCVYTFCRLAAQTEQALMRSNVLAERLLEGKLQPLASLFAASRAAHWNQPNTNLSCVKQTTLPQDDMIGKAFHMSGMLLPNALIGRYNIGQDKSVRDYLEQTMRLFSDNGGGLKLPCDGEYSFNGLLDHVTDNKCFTGLFVPQIERIYCKEQERNFYDLKLMMNSQAMSTLVVATGQSEWTEAITNGRPIGELRKQFGVNFAGLMRGGGHA